MKSYENGRHESFHKLLAKNVLSCELVSATPPMFDKSVEMRITKTKSSLKTKLQVEQSECFLSPADVTILGGCAMLWVVRWAAHSLVHTCIHNRIQLAVGDMTMSG